MPRDEDTIRVEPHTGPRARLRPLFELAEDSAAELDAYIETGRVLVARAGDRVGFRMRSVERDAFTPATGYAPGIEIDGIALRDRVWLDRDLGA